MGKDKLEAITAQALSRLFADHAGALELFARQYCDSPEDVVQHAFLKLVNVRTRPDDVVPYLYRMVRNGAISVARSAARRQSRERRVAAREEPWFEPTHLEDMDARAAGETLQTLPQDEREIIVAHIYSGLTFEEIGQVMGCSNSTAHRRYKDALNSLRERLKSPCTKKNTNES
jgi:RNA polymerase sigma-70 factor (ECF subfamily)